MSAARGPIVVRLRVIDDATVADVVGELDLACEADLRMALASAWTQSAGRLVANLAGVAFVDIRGLQVLLDVSQRAEREGGAFAVAAPPRSLRRLTELLRTGRPATHASVSAAVAALAAGAQGTPARQGPEDGTPPDRRGGGLPSGGRGTPALPDQRWAGEQPMQREGTARWPVRRCPSPPRPGSDRPRAQ